MMMVSSISYLTNHAVVRIIYRQYRVEWSSSSVWAITKTCTMSLTMTFTSLRKNIFDVAFKNTKSKCIKGGFLTEEANVELKTIMDQFLEHWKEREPKFINIFKNYYDRPFIHTNAVI